MVTRYEINYSYTANSCQSQPIPNVIVNVSGTVRSHKLLNTSETPIEEDSIYTISITAINPAGRSQAPAIVHPTTLPSGGYVSLYIMFCY